MKNFTRNQLHRCNVPPNHRPACSSISQQRCHPRAGHDSSRTKGTNCRLAHSQGVINIKPTQLGFTGFQQTSQASTVRRPTIALRQLLSYHSLNKENEFWVILGPIVAKMTLIRIYNSSRRNSKDIHNMGKTTAPNLWVCTTYSRVKRPK